MPKAANTEVEDQDTDAEGGAAVVDEQQDDDAQLGDEQHDDDPEGESTDEGDGEGEGDEVVVTIGEESPPSEEDENRAPEWVRELRKSNREKDRAIRERDAEIARLKGSAGGQPAAVVVGDKPTLEGCDYDAEKFERELEAWHARKREADDQVAKKQKADEEQRTAWQARLDAYGTAKAKLKVKDFEDAEAAAQDLFSVTQQGVILNGAENPALLVYALGKNPKKAKELASIADPVKFAFAVAKLETQLKVTPRKSAPPPERTVRSSVAGAAAVDNQLERLRAEAAKTGDLSKVIAYKNAQRTKERGK